MFIVLDEYKIKQVKSFPRRKKKNRQCRQFDKSPKVGVVQGWGYTAFTT